MVLVAFSSLCSGNREQTQNLAALQADQRDTREMVMWCQDHLVTEQAKQVLRLMRLTNFSSRLSL